MANKSVSAASVPVDPLISKIIGRIAVKADHGNAGDFKWVFVHPSGKTSCYPSADNKYKSTHTTDGLTFWVGPSEQPFPSDVSRIVKKGTVDIAHLGAMESYHWIAWISTPGNFASILYLTCKIPLAQSAGFLETL